MADTATTQTDLDRLHIAWNKVKGMLNTNVPGYASRMATIRAKAQNNDQGHGK